MQIMKVSSQKQLPMTDKIRQLKDLTEGPIGERKDWQAIVKIAY